MSQLELFPVQSPPAAAEPTVPSVESIRARFETLLDMLRGPDVMPLSVRELAFWIVVPPQMSNWFALGRCRILRIYLSLNGGFGPPRRAEGSRLFGRTGQGRIQAL